ncbi:MAG: enoyl-CoA hydratase [Alphaproteobacteria bacterium PA4]|nr:MAG: enoyl-CoA hydratase [Alphaproteobacteria bacterium PA4]
MAEGHFRVEHDGAIAILTHARGAKRNALTAGTLRQLQGIAEQLREEPGIRAVIIRAEGADFSVGMDIGGMGSGGDAAATPQAPVVQARRTAELGARLMRALREIPQPTICAVQGIANGGAACIATACDFRLGSRDARIGYGEVRLGINLMWQALPLAIQAVGLARAKRMVMTGALFDAATLLDWGFFDEIVPPEALDAAARRWAEAFVALPPVAVQMIKRSANAWAGALDQAIMHADADQWLLASRTDDFGEAVSAFFARRTPQFTGN